MKNVMKYPPNLFIGITAVGPLDKDFAYPLTFAAEDLLPLSTERKRNKKINTRDKASSIRNLKELLGRNLTIYDGTCSGDIRVLSDFGLAEISWQFTKHKAQIFAYHLSDQLGTVLRPLPLEIAIYEESYTVTILGSVTEGGYVREGNESNVVAGLKAALSTMRF